MPLDRRLEMVGYLDRRKMRLRSAIYSSVISRDWSDTDMLRSHTACMTDHVHMY